MDLNFECTQCGKCCHDLKLQLTVDEALRWASDGHQVQLLCEAIPWVSDPDPADSVPRYKGVRAFPASSGALAVRINVILAAAFDGPCPHLKPRMLCGNYDARPRVCRIYPAEIAPHLALDPAAKSCPAEAWSDDVPPFVREGEVVDLATRGLIEEFRAATIDDVAIKAHACFELAVSRAALANEGFAVHAPPPERLVEVLHRVRESGPQPGLAGNWQIVTNRAASLEMLTDVGADCALAMDEIAYIGFFRPEPASMSAGDDQHK